MSAARSARSFYEEVPGADEQGDRVEAWLAEQVALIELEDGPGPLI